MDDVVVLDGVVVLDVVVVLDRVVLVVEVDVFYYYRRRENLYSKYRTQSSVNTDVFSTVQARSAQLTSSKSHIEYWKYRCP